MLGGSSKRNLMPLNCCNGFQGESGFWVHTYSTYGSHVYLLFSEKASSALFFKHNMQLGPPYQVLVDTNFINFSIKNKVRGVGARAVLHGHGNATCDACNGSICRHHDGQIIWMGALSVTVNDLFPQLGFHSLQGGLPVR